jgi:hypothetical protein
MNQDNNFQPGWSGNGRNASADPRKSTKAYAALEDRIQEYEQYGMANVDDPYMPILTLAQAQLFRLAAELQDTIAHQLQHARPGHDPSRKRTMDSYLAVLRRIESCARRQMARPAVGQLTADCERQDKRSDIRKKAM